MTVADRLETANADLTQLCGKQVELSRERSRLGNHKQVFLAELERIDAELSTVDTSLDEINTKCSSVRWRIARLRFQRFLQILCRCLFYVYTLLTFVLINVLYVLYVILMMAANLARTILDSQIGMSGLSATKSNRDDDSLCWS